MKITILGAGAWGTALGLLIYSNLSCNEQITIWDFHSSVIDNIKQYSTNTDYLPGIDIPKGIQPVRSIEDALDSSDIIVSATPSIGLAHILKYFNDEVLSRAKAIVSATKGFEPNTNMRVSEYFQKMTGQDLNDKYVVLSGPSFALEVAKNKITAVSVASRNISRAREISEFLSTDHFRCYSTDDVTGVELGGALKNIMAIGAGIIDGLFLGDNTRAAYITRALVEMIRFSVFNGARKDTLYGLSGVGDLFLTCSGSLSRNRSVGLGLAKGTKLEEIARTGKGIAEGIKTTKVVHDIAKKNGIEMPITDTLYSIMYEDYSVTEGIKSLMKRELKDEKV